MLNFMKLHECTYLYGSGKCGSGFMEYCDVCGFDIKGFVTSDTLKQFLEEYQPGKYGLILTLKSDYYPEILPLLWGKVDIKDILLFKESTKDIFIRTFSREYLENNMWIVLPLAKHCIVNCASCNMFSPICDKEFYTYEEVKRDVDHLKAIELHLSKINITGGEPLLNPEFVDILGYIRSRYDNLRIEVYTTALPIGNFSEEELKQIGMISPTFMVTDYGINESVFKSALETLDFYGIKYQVNLDGDGKKFYKKIIDFDRNVPKYEYINCQYYTFCFAPILFNGVLYKCPMALNSDAINGAFDKNIELTDEDFLKLCNVDKPSQIYDFWRHRLSMCSYCPPVTESVPWRKSERKIEEWT